MIRWIVVFSTLLLGGCVTTEYVYRDGYHRDGYADGRYVDEGAYERRVYVDGSYYSPSYADRGDYYYSPGYSSYPSYFDYPAYYSVFWPLHRSWYDPFYYPNYYYGVTFYPRNYLSIGFGGSYGWPRYSSWYYSPYRYSWVDNYYDWRPWYGHSHHRDRYSPRFGSARNEAERLSRVSDRDYYGRGGGYRGDGYRNDRRDDRVSDAVRRTPYGTYGTTRDPSRDADYGSASSPRRDTGMRGFGVPTDAGDVRRTGQYDTSTNRQLPRERGFGVPVEGRGDVRRDAQMEQGVPIGRSADYGAAREASRIGNGGYAAPRATNRGYDNGGGAERYQRAPARDYSRAERAPRGYDGGGYDGGGYAVPQQRQAPVERGYREPVYQERGYQDRGQRYERAPARDYAAPGRGYDGGGGGRAAPSYSAPAPSYSAPAPSYSEPAPRYESRESRSEPSYESRSESRSGGRGDGGGSRGEVRRVGNNRED